MCGADRSRRYRQRRLDGVLMVTGLEITAEHVTGLIEKGYLSGATSDGETKVKKEAVIEAAQWFWNDAIA